MKKLLFLCSLFLLGVACSNEDSLTATVDPVPEDGGNTNPYAVTVEEALANLDGVLAQIDGETRAGGMRRAVSVDRVKAADVCDLTRSEAALDVEDLLYVVSFGEGNGSAVLGADKRVTPVLAVLDETVLTAEDFVKFDTRATSLEELTPEEDLRNLLTGMMTTTAEIEVANFDGEIIEPFPLTRYETTYTYTTKGPLLNTKWGQSAPFNNSCPYKDNSTTARKYAGCVPVGVGQILAYHQYPSPNIIDDTLYSWTLINQLNYPVDYASCSDEAKKVVADYLFKIGSLMNADYRNDGTGVGTPDQLAFLHSIGLTNARSTSWNSYNAKSSIFTNEKPVGLSASRYDSVEMKYSGHYWVLDGWMNELKEEWKIEKGINDIFPRRTLLSSATYEYVHCNYGYNGDCDGYYTPNMYDLSEERTGVYIDTEAGDVADTMDRNYCYYIKTIYFE